MQTKRVTQTETETQWETLRTMWQRFANRQTTTRAHIHWYTHTNTPTPTHTKTDRRTHRNLTQKPTHAISSFLTDDKWVSDTCLSLLYFFLFFFIENRYVLMRRIKRAQSIYLFYLYYTFLTRKQHNKLFLFLFFFESFPFFLFFLLLFFQKI